MSPTGSGKIEYRGQQWDMGDPLAPPALTELFRKEELARRMSSEDQQELSATWRFLETVSNGILCLAKINKLAKKIFSFFSGGENN